MEYALLEAEAGGPEETKLFQSLECGQGRLPGRGVFELVLKDGSNGISRGGCVGAGCGGWVQQ